MKKIFISVLVIVVSLMIFASCKSTDNSKDQQPIPASDSTIESETDSGEGESYAVEDDSSDQSLTTPRKVVKPISGVGGYVFD